MFRDLGRIVIVVVVATACTTDHPLEDDPALDAGTAAFCGQAVRILDLNPGDDPLVMDRQMARLEDTAQVLEGGMADSVVRTIDRVRSDIDAAIASPDPGGWSSVRVADLVSGMCNEDVIGWTIQP